MFNNLIESSSHAREFRRRGSFILFTSVTYVLLFTIAGVLSIFAYDARLEDPSTEIVTMLTPLDVVTPQPASITRNSPPPRATHRSDIAERAIAMASVNHPESVPKTTSAKPNTNKPLPERGLYRITGRDIDPVGPGVSGEAEHGNRRDAIGGRTPAIEVGTPPPAPIQKPVPKLVSKGVITSQAISLPKPSYPPLARQTSTQGVVSVQVLIDETGKVVSAKTVSGHPLLAAAAQRAAYEARFSPTMLGDQPVKVSGVITYNFVLE